MDTVHMVYLTVFKFIDIFRKLTSQCLCIMSALYVHRVPKKGATKFMVITSPNLNRFSKIFHHWKEKKIPNKIHTLFPTTTFGKLKFQIFIINLEENTRKKCHMNQLSFHS